jgi:hypothetical protein
MDAFDRSMLDNLMRGGGLGLTESITSLAALPGLLIPGEDPFERFEERAGAAAQEFFDPERTAGSVGRFIGRGVGEGAQVLLGGAGIAKGAAKAVPKVGTALKAMREGTRLQRMGADILPFMPVDLAIGAGRAMQDDRNVIAGALGEVALGAAFGGAASLGLQKLGAVRAARRARADRAVAEFATTDAELAAKAAAQPGGARTMSEAIELAGRLGDEGMHGEAARVIREATGRAESMSDDALRKALDDPTDYMEEMDDIQTALEETYEQLIKNPAQREVIMASKGARLMHRLAEAVELGGLEPSAIPKLVDDLGLDKTQAAGLFSEMMQEAISAGGRVLNRVSQFRKLLGQLSDRDLKALGLEAIRAEQSVFQRMRARYIRPVIDLWRASITSQLATSQRNFAVGAIRGVMSFFEDVMANAVRSFTGATGWKQTGDSAIEAATATWAAMSRGGRATFDKILKEYPDVYQRLYKTPIMEMAATGAERPGGYRRVINALQIFNRAQENWVRRIGFANRLGARLGELGIDTLKLSREGIEAFTKKERGQIRKAMNEATTHALDITFAQGTKEFRAGGGGRWLMRLYRDLPELALVHPFPRFLANSMKFLWERTAVWRMFRITEPEVKRRIAAVTFEQAKEIAIDELGGGAGAKAITKRARAIVKRAPTEAQEIAKAMEGFFLMSAAVALRGSPLAGPKWYQIRVGSNERGQDIYFDTRPFAPLSTFMFMAEIIEQVTERGLDVIFPGGEFRRRNTEMEPKDIMDAFLGIRRLTGTGLYLIDAVFDDTVEGFMRKVGVWVGELLGGFTTPGRTLKSMLSAMDPEEGVVRDIRMQPEIGDVKIPQVFSRFVANLPVAGKEMLPPAHRATREQPMGAGEEYGISGRVGTGIGGAVAGGLVGGLPGAVVGGTLGAATGTAPQAARQLTGVTLQTQTPIERELDRLQMRGYTRTGVPSLDNATDDIMGDMVERTRLDSLVQGESYQRLNDFQKVLVLRRVLREFRTPAKNIAVQRYGLNIIEDVADKLRGRHPSDIKRIVDALDIPQVLKIAIIINAQRRR